jgi:predicted dehydrogenase
LGGGEHAAYQACPNEALVAVGSRKEESAKSCGVRRRRRRSPLPILNAARSPDVDIISITTPRIRTRVDHRAPARENTSASKSPRAGLESCLRCEGRQNRRKTIVSFCLHWNPSLMNTRKLIDSGDCTL